MTDDDALRLPEGVDPARWPFCEARARELTARASFPDLPDIAIARDPAARRRDVFAYRAGRTFNPAVTQRGQWEARRHAERVAS